jgi:WD40-like Beta Propeller Repeat
VWSPSGTKLAFLSYRTGDAEVFVMNAGGSGQTDVSRTSGADDRGAGWSPDGLQLAYTTYDASGSSAAVVVGADGTGRTVLTDWSSNGYVGDAVDSHGGYWSRDGCRLVVSADGDLETIDAPVAPYAFDGFYGIANAPALNQARAGQAIVLSFGLGGNRGLDVFAAGYPRSQAISCDSKTVIGSDGAESAALYYANGRYRYQWRTQRAWTRTCRQLVLRFRDGTERRAYFRFAS